MRYGQTYRYECVGTFNQLAQARCISFGGMRLDRARAKDVLDRVQPLGVEAAVAAIEACRQQRSEKKGQLELALRQAHYEAARARRQYDGADPENRLVAGELERRWNERLIAVRDLELEIERLDADEAPALSEADRARLIGLGQDLARAWDSPGATPETRKKIIRTVITEIIVDAVGDRLELIIHWQGGDHTRLAAKRNRPGQTRWTTEADVVELVHALARQMPDGAIAAVLNRSGKTTGHGNSWTRGRVCSLRRHYDIAVYRDGERAERGEANAWRNGRGACPQSVDHPPPHRRGHASCGTTLQRRTLDHSASRHRARRDTPPGRSTSLTMPVARRTPAKFPRSINNMMR